MVKRVEELHELSQVIRDKEAALNDLKASREEMVDKRDKLRRRNEELREARQDLILLFNEAFKSDPTPSPHLPHLSSLTTDLHKVDEDLRSHKLSMLLIKDIISYLNETLRESNRASGRMTSSVDRAVRSYNARKYFEKVERTLASVVEMVPVCRNLLRNLSHTLPQAIEILHNNLVATLHYLSSAVATITPVLHSLLDRIYSVRRLIMAGWVERIEIAVALGGFEHVRVEKWEALERFAGVDGGIGSVVVAGMGGFVRSLQVVG
ncbi:hypothetical protein HDU67_001419 [Dinochytrium kinnereticum]|nr:hypothetical protein HDU67_001419 [Dinochytrium kinnereticum]